MKKVGHILGSYQPKKEVVCLIGRWGGEEFLMIIPYDSNKLAKYVAEEIREVISNSDFSEIETSVGKSFKEKVTVSLGLNYVDLSSLINPSEIDIENKEDILEDKIDYALDMADVALDYAKFMGRNRVEVICEEVEKVMDDVGVLRKFYFYNSGKSPEQVEAFSDNYALNNQKIMDRIKSHFEIIRSEINPLDTRTQAVFADKIYRDLLAKGDYAQIQGFMDFIRKYTVNES